MRADGRDNHALRPVEITPNCLEFAEGSALIACGKTRVLCAATVEESVPSWLLGKGQGWVTGEYAMLPRATHTRTPREVNRPSGRTQEIRRLIGRALRASVDLAALGERTLIIDCDVLQADGGTRTAAVTGGYVAMRLALQRLFDAGQLSDSALRAPVAAVSVGIVAGERLLDLCYAEDSQAQVDMNVVMNGSGALIDVQGTAEGEPFSRDDLDALLDLAQRGIAQLLDAQNRILEAGQE